MNFISYPSIIDSPSIVFLKKEVEYFHPLMEKNKWIGVYDEPENTIEKYIQDSFDFYLKDTLGTPVGFEWWIQIFTDDSSIPFHTSHDESKRINEGKMSYPLSSTITYLTDNTSPTIITNTSNGDYLEELYNFPPTEVIFSIPTEGKFVTCDSRYIRGVHPNQNAGRITLCYDVWHYKPTGLDRVGILSEPFPCRFYKPKERPPVTWLGKTKDCTSNLYDKTFTFKYPTIYREGETWKVNQ